MPLIQGTAGNDQLVSVDTDGDDELRGLAGADTITANRPGSDSLNGGDGDDELTVQRSTGVSSVTLDGGDGNDRLEVNGIFPIGGGKITASIAGGAGADFIFVYGDVSGTIVAGSGDDTLRFGPEHGLLSVQLGEGVDTVELGVSPFGMATSALTLSDFRAGAGGDVLQLPAASSQLLINWDGSNPFAAGYLRLVASGDDTVLQIDADAAGGAHAFRELVRFSQTQVNAFTAVNFAGYPPAGGPTPGQVITGSNTPGQERLTGTSGNDTIIGLGLNDIIRGGAGDDRIDAGDGNDHIDGEAGDDVVSGGEGADTITGGQRDLLRGDAGDDQIGVLATLSESVRVTLDGGEGDDRLFTDQLHEGQSALVLGGAGRDLIYLNGAGAVTVDAGPGNDLLQLSSWPAASTVTLGAGADVLRIDPYATNPPPVTLTDFAPASGDRFRVAEFLQRANPSWDPETNPFTAGLIRLVAQGSATVVQIRSQGQFWDAFTLQNVSPSALDGTHFEGYRPDGGAPQGLNLQGDAVAEELVGGVGGDRLAGGDGADTLDGGRGDDNLTGDAGADSLSGGLGNDTASGGIGNDSLSDSGGSNYLRGDEGDDQLQGGSGFDDINGNMGADFASGGAGDDWVVGGKDNDILYGGVGGDLVYGNLGADTCDGEDGADIVRGGQDNDLVRGGGGDDYVSGDRGDDTVTGGAGADLFHTFGDAGLDRVTDFSAGQGDRVLLDPGTSYSVAQAGADTVINMVGGGQMVLVGVSMNALPAGWIFGA